jgi:hypothetical protein
MAITLLRHQRKAGTRKVPGGAFWRRCPYSSRFFPFGRVKLKVLPLPTVLTAHIRP